MNIYNKLITFALVYIPSILAAQTIEPFTQDYYSHTAITFEHGWIMDPIYNIQGSSNYRLDGKKITNGNGSYLNADTRFYSVLPGTLPNEHFLSFDQSSSYFFTFRLRKKANASWLRNTFYQSNSLVFGITHDKMQSSNFRTSSNSKISQYKFDNGGMEFTLMYRKYYNLLKWYPFRDMDLADDGLSLVCGWELGPFISCDDIGVDLKTPDGRYIDSIYNKRVFGDGCGLIADVKLSLVIRIVTLNNAIKIKTKEKVNFYKNKEIIKNVKRSYRRGLYLMIGPNIMGEFVHSNPQVKVTNINTGIVESGTHHLDVNTYGLSISPSINFIFKL